MQKLFIFHYIFRQLKLSSSGEVLTFFSQLIQIWQLFKILKQPVHIIVTVFYNLTKLTDHLFIFAIEIYNNIILSMGGSTSCSSQISLWLKRLNKFISYHHIIRPCLLCLHSDYLIFRVLFLRLTYEAS